MRAFHQLLEDSLFQQQRNYRKLSLLNIDWQEQVDLGPSRPVGSFSHPDRPELVRSEPPKSRPVSFLSKVSTLPRLLYDNRAF